ncbi:glycoside hydrolase family 3 N-terminal domain-containing protein [Tessaracoccus coleopterorum]|uniref:glycoside hydrolase family 3 N-terminal domain-containing protein n=1 Tax=Tessaracoccus coleopterorum TaxID=2714950 RepID=UPI002F90E7F6
MEEVGDALGAEAAAEDVQVLLGPGLNIKRSPLGGRNFEYLSEDPFLTGKLAAAFVRGIQGRGVAACPKHFAVNSQETHRMTVDEIVDRRALHEIFLEGFRRAVVEGRPRTIMTSYNRVNGTYAHENPYLLTDVLREGWGFDGMVVSDWGGSFDRVAATRAGASLEMPSTDGMTDREVIDAVRAGSLDEAVLDARVDEVLTVALAERGRPCRRCPTTRPTPAPSTRPHGRWCC